MFNPLRLVEDNFEDSKLSNANLRAFTEDHLVRLSQPDNNPGGMYNTMITDTTTKYTNYYGKITNEATKKAIAEGTTITRNNARQAAEDKINSLQGLVKFVFGEDSAIYQEFYPQGLTEYTRAREGDIGTLFDRFVTAATTHLSAGYPAEVSTITTLVNDFDTAYTARETIMSQVDIVTTGKHADRKALTVQLTYNFLVIASNNIDNPDRFDDYYNASYLPIESDTESNILLDEDVTIHNAEIINVPITGFVLLEDDEIIFTNPTTSAVVEVGFGSDAGSILSPTLVEAGTVLSKTAAELGFDVNHPLLNIRNITVATAEVNVKIRRN